MLIRIWYILILAVCFLTLAGCGRKGHDESLRALSKKAEKAMSTAEMKGLDSLGNLLLERSEKANDRNYEAWAHFYLSAYKDDLPDNVKAQKMRHLEEAERLASEIKNDTLLSHVYNLRGVWEVYSLRPSTAQYWLLRSLETGKNLPKRFLVPAQMNLSEVCRIIEDTIGIAYDRDMLDFATKNGEPVLRFTAALHCAYYYARTARDTAELRPYIDNIRLLENKFPGVDNYIYAYYFSKHGDYPSAGRMMEQVGMNTSDVQVLRADILHHLGKYAESEQILDAVAAREDMMFSRDYARYLYLRAQNQQAMGNSAEAYRSMEVYNAYRDSMQEARSTDLIRRARVEFDVMAKEREIAKQRDHIRNIRIITGAVVLILLMVIAAIVMWQRRRNRFYKDIVRQNREFLRREAALSENKPADIPAENKEPESQPEKVPAEGRNPKITEEKSSEIWSAIRRLTEQEQLWRDQNVTREIMAARCGVNRTYFSQVLKEKTGMNYSQYMNACRIREAVRVLSDANDETSLRDLSEQLGFLSIQTFYSCFKREIGMSPAAYRKTACEM